MTHKEEIEALQDKARRAGRTANLCINENGTITAVCYLDPKSAGAFRAGKVIDVLTFAETERAKPAWWKLV